MENKFTEKSVEAISEAHNYAVRYKSPDMKVEHLLLALVGQMEGLIPKLLQKMGINTSNLINKLSAKLDSFSKVEGSSGDPRPNAELNRVLVQAEDYMKKYHDSYISTEHLFLAAFDNNNFLKANNINKDQFEKKKHGYGVINIITRLRLKYGEDVRFFYESDTNGTVCVIQIPDDGKENSEQ